jgi:hypothetical protein
LSVATTAAQVATIASQQFTPMATGGLVTSPTRTLLGEAGPELVLPLNKASETLGLENPTQGTINVTVNIGNAYTKEDLAKDVFEGIQQAQRIGALPKWKVNSQAR